MHVYPKNKSNLLWISFFIWFFSFKSKEAASLELRTDYFKEVINAVKKCSSELYTFGIRATGIV